MKSLILALTLLLSTSAFARQYIQCSAYDSSDVIVVNLQNAQGGTLFLSSGMENPDDERILVKLAFDKIENGHHVFNVVEEVGTATVTVPSNVIGKAVVGFTVQVIFSTMNQQFSCFSSIYND